MDGFLLVDKPPGCTSFNIVSLCRKALRETRVGHSGTLDPFATGLLIVAVGEALKLLEYIPAEPKEYMGTAFFGATSSTYDTEGEITPSAPPLSLITKIDLAMINKVIQAKFLGSIMQVPPAHSAVKVRGVPAYIRARRGEELSLAARPSTISLFEVTEFSYPTCSFRVQVSSGTYIRSLFHDLGQALGVGAYLTSLRRTRIADFSIDRAMSVPELESQVLAEEDIAGDVLTSRLLPLEMAVAHLPRKDISPQEYTRLSHGLYLDLTPSDLSLLEEGRPALTAFLDGQLVGILEFTATNQLKFRKKLNIPLL